jgi:hypothetical protein
MGPFTESLIYALHNSSGEILDVFGVAARKTAEMSPGQEPVLHRSKFIDPVVLRQKAAELEDTRAKDLLNRAELPYRDRAWSDFLADVSRGRVLASSSELRERLSREVDFGTSVKEAEALEEARNWSDAAARWQKAADLFPARHWVRMRCAVAWLMVDDLPHAVRSLAVVAAHPESEAGLQAKQVLADLLKAFPALEPEARKAAEASEKASGAEFELVKHEEQGDE